MAGIETIDELRPPYVSDMCLSSICRVDSTPGGQGGHIRALAGYGGAGTLTENVREVRDSAGRRAGGGGGILFAPERDFSNRYGRTREQPAGQPVVCTSDGRRPEENIIFITSENELLFRRGNSRELLTETPSGPYVDGVRTLRQRAPSLPF